jgi:hypothetical protein
MKLINKHAGEMEPIFRDLRNIFNVTLDPMNIDTISRYIDAHDAISFNQIKIEPDFTMEAKNLFPKYFKYLFYEGVFGNPKTAILASSEFFRYIYTTFRG